MFWKRLTEADLQVPISGWELPEKNSKLFTVYHDGNGYYCLMNGDLVLLRMYRVPAYQTVRIFSSGTATGQRHSNGRLIRTATER